MIFFFFPHQSINFAGSEKLGRSKAKSAVSRKCTSILYSEIFFLSPPHPPRPPAIHWLFFLKPICQTQEVVPRTETCLEGNGSLSETSLHTNSPVCPDVVAHLPKHLPPSERRSLSSRTYLSAERAVSVKTDTPTEVSWIKGITLQPVLPNSHLSARYLLASTGAQVTRSSRSPTARLEMNRFGTFRMDFTVQKILIRVMLPTRPIRMMTP